MRFPLLNRDKGPSSINSQDLAKRADNPYVQSDLCKNNPNML